MAHSHVLPFCVILRFNAADHSLIVGGVATILPPEIVELRLVRSFLLEQLPLVEKSKLLIYCLYYKL